MIPFPLPVALPMGTYTLGLLDDCSALIDIGAAPLGGVAPIPLTIGRSVDVADFTQKWTDGALTFAPVALCPGLGAINLCDAHGVIASAIVRLG